MDRNFWLGKRVLVTGHTGFKGSWLCIWLKKLGAEVSGFSLEPNTSPALFEVARVASGINSQFGDIRSAAATLEIIYETSPEIVIHMAAQPLVQQSYADPVATYATNVMGTVNILEAVRQVGSVRAVINVTSDKCYENKEWVWAYRECDALGGYDPYSSSKGCSELVTSAYRRAFFSDKKIALASARSGNVIGGGDWTSGRLVPDVLRALEVGEAVELRNSGATRPWQHVLDPLAGYLMLAHKLFQEGSSYAEAWNFGPNADNAISVQELVDKLFGHCQFTAGWSHDDRAWRHEAQSLRLDNSKAVHGLGWRPMWSIDETLQKIAEWHKGWRGGLDAESLCIGQIDAYHQQVDNMTGAP